MVMSRLVDVMWMLSILIQLFAPVERAQGSHHQQQATASQTNKQASGCIPVVAAVGILANFRYEKMPLPRPVAKFARIPLVLVARTGMHLFAVPRTPLDTNRTILRMMPEVHSLQLKKGHPDDETQGTANGREAPP
jgi:hypothetical protein